VGDFEALALASVESTLKYHPFCAGTLTSVRDPDQEQRQVGSLTGAVALTKVGRIMGNHVR
jgi:hypothetical protein